MNYRHIYHAGGIADLFKHTVLLGLLDRLRQKKTPFFVLDTHAGIGLYNLAREEAVKTGEYLSGIGALWRTEPHTPLLQGLLQQVRDINASELHLYPGSPVLIQNQLRAQDRAAFCELHPDDFYTLQHIVKKTAHVAVHRRDAYEAIGALLPPPEPRGLILIDPPYEVTDELERAARAIATGCHKFPAGIWALWYPVKDAAALWLFQETMIATGLRKQLIIEFLTDSEGDGRTLSGSGMLLINPPYRLADTLRPALAELQSLLSLDKGSVTIKWLVEE